MDDKEIIIYGKAWRNKTFSYSCLAQIGNDPIYSKFETIGKIQNLNPICMTKGGFSGNCHLCSIKGHSKHYCPKQYCNSCDAYGHSDKVCTNPNKECLKEFEILPKPFYRRSKYKKTQFGSGWHQQKKDYLSDEIELICIN